MKTNLKKVKTEIKQLDKETLKKLDKYINEVIYIINGSYNEYGQFIYNGSRGYYFEVDDILDEQLLSYIEILKICLQENILIPKKHFKKYEKDMTYNKIVNFGCYGHNDQTINIYKEKLIMNNLIK